jgi:hypothetical protein
MLVCFIWSVLAAPFRSNSELEVENAAHERRSAVLHPAVSTVSVGSQGDGDRSAGDRPALAAGWLSSLLAMEIAGTARVAANQSGATQSDPADEP